MGLNLGSQYSMDIMAVCMKFIEGNDSIGTIPGKNSKPGKILKFLERANRDFLTPIQKSTILVPCSLFLLPVRHKDGKQAGRPIFKNHQSLFLVLHSYGRINREDGMQTGRPIFNNQQSLFLVLYSYGRYGMKTVSRREGQY
jgi:hypothetical protein